MTAAWRWGTVLGVGGASALVGLWMRSLGIFSAGAAMIALRASAVPFGSPPSFEAIGSDLPPLPIALAMPLAAIPSLRWDPFAPVVVSALAAGVAAWWVFRSARAMGLGVIVSSIVALGVSAHPAWLYAAATGSGSVLAAALLVAALRLFRRWQRSGEALPLLASSFALALGGLARYDLFIVGWAIALLIALGPRVRRDEPRDERPAFSVAYASAITGALGLWLVTTGLLTGDVLAFIGRSRDAVAGPPVGQVPGHALLVLIPALGAAALAALLRRANATVIATIVLALCAVAASTLSGAALSLDSVVPLVPLTGLLVAEIVAPRSAARATLALAVPALLLAGALALQMSPDWGEGHRGAVDAVVGRAPLPMWSGERDAARSIRGSQGTIVIDDRVDGVAALLIASPDRIARVESVAGLASGAPRADLVLVRTPTGRGAAHRVAMTWPTLYAGGAPWAMLVGSWPVSGEAAEYRLYAVLPVGRR